MAVTPLGESERTQPALDTRAALAVRRQSRALTAVSRHIPQKCTDDLARSQVASRATFLWGYVKPWLLPVPVLSTSWLP